MNNIQLTNGVEMPLIGMGTFAFPINRWNLVKLIYQATLAGVRSIDTASAYGNEIWVGAGVLLTPIRRKKLFITTKLSNGQQNSGDVETALRNSLRNLRTRYVDLYLMHWPNPGTYIDCWKQMEVLYKKGFARAIGVCNFHQHHFEELFKTAEIKPMVNQVELHPLLSQKPLVKFCSQHDIKVEAYSPLARMHEKLTANQTLCEIAKRHKKSVPQVVLRWNFQNGIPAVPKSIRIERVKENTDILDFNLSNDEINLIDAINQNFRVRHDPDNCDFSKL